MKQTECIGLSLCGGPCDASCPAAREKNIEAQHSGGVAGGLGTANSAMVPCSEVLAILDSKMFGPLNKVKKVRELLAQHQ